MQIVLGILVLILLILTVFYYKECERSNIDIYNLECKLDDAVRKNKQLENKIKKIEEERDNAIDYSERKIRRELYKLVFQSQNYNSLEDLQNKIKTVLTCK